MVSLPTLGSPCSHDPPGYLVLDGFSSQEECAKLRKRMDRLLADFDPKTISIFTTTNQVGRARRTCVPCGTYLAC